MSPNEKGYEFNKIYSIESEDVAAVAQLMRRSKLSALPGTIYAMFAADIVLSRYDAVKLRSCSISPRRAPEVGDEIAVKMAVSSSRLIELRHLGKRRLLQFVITGYSQGGPVFSGSAEIVIPV